MELEFIQVDNLYTTTFEVNNNFNLHLEFKEDYQDITVYQKTDGTDKSELATLDHHYGTLDVDVTNGEVFPKEITITVNSEVTYGSFTEA